MKWRVIDYTENNAHMNMAIDEAVSEYVAKGGPPTIRFYGWKPSAVSIGYFQSLEREVDIKKCDSENVDFVRRRTGGGAVYHDNKGEITYSVIAKEEIFPKDIIASYKVICSWIINALKSLEIESEFKPINDIIAGGKKISGNAQTRRKGVLLQHGTILYSLDLEKMFSLLKVSDEKIRDKMIVSSKERVTCVTNFGNIERDRLYRAMLAEFSKGKEVFFDSLSKEEIDMAIELEKKYKSKEWNCLK